MRKVAILTPSLDGRVHARYAYSLSETVRLASCHGVFVQPVMITNDALIERARNDLLAIAYKSDVTDAIWIDSDEAWQPEWVLELLAYQVDVVGGTARHKRDIESYVVNADPDHLVRDDNGLMAVRKLGCGFLRTSRKALDLLWKHGEPYSEDGEHKRWTFDARPVDGALVSEDTSIFDVFAKARMPVYLAPHMCCDHMGEKIYSGDFELWLERFNAQRKAA